jgi:hypothetical protein
MKVLVLAARVLIIGIREDLNLCSYAGLSNSPARLD